MSDDNDNKKKAPKLFRPGEVPSKETANEPKKPKLFKPGESTPPSSSTPKEQPKLFKPSAPAAPATPPSTAKPKLFKPANPQPQDSAPEKQVPPSKPKLFKPEEKAPPPEPKKRKVTAADLLNTLPTKEESAPAEKPPESSKKTATASDLMGTLEKPKKKEKPTKAAKTSSDVKAKSRGQSLIREELFGEVDVRQMWYKAMLAGFLASLSMLLISYVVYTFDDTSILTKTMVFTAYSQGNIFNEAIGLWAVSFTPASALSAIDPEWLDAWTIHLAPTMVAGLIIGLQVKNLKYSFLGVFFFMVFSIFLTFGYLVIGPMLSLVDPSSIDAGLISAFPEIIDNWSGFLVTVREATHSIFFAWVVGGSLELGLISIIFVIPFSILFGVLKLVFSKSQ